MIPIVRPWKQVQGHGTAGGDPALKQTRQNPSLVLCSSFTQYNKMKLRPQKQRGSRCFHLVAGLVQEEKKVKALGRATSPYPILCPRQRSSLSQPSSGLRVSIEAPGSGSALSFSSAKQMITLCTEVTGREDAVSTLPSVACGAA